MCDKINDYLKSLIKDKNELIPIQIPRWYIDFLLKILEDAEYQERKERGKWERGGTYFQYQYSPTKRSKQIVWIRNFLGKQIAEREQNEGTHQD
jgi:hypothetical protein